MKIHKLVISLPLLLFSCLSITPKFDPFYCKVNGNDFRPQVDNSPIGGTGSDPLKLSYDNVNNWYYVSAYNVPYSISLFIKLPQNEYISVREFNLGKNINDSRAYYYSGGSSSTSDEFISTEGKIIITEMEGRTFYATFEFKAKSNKTNNEVIITNGKFTNKSKYPL